MKAARPRRKYWWRPWIWRILAVGSLVYGFWWLQHSPYPKAALQRALSGMTAISRTWSGLTSGVADHFGAVAENARLRRQIEQFTWQMQSFESLIAENQRLRTLLQAVPPPEHRRLTVPIIGRSPDTWHAQVVLGAGRADGVTLDAAAMTAEGLVGRVVQVGEHHATLQLVTDPLSAISAQAVRSGTYGMVTGQKGTAAGFDYLRQNADVKQGDLISTSGLGVFPKGIPVGIVREVKRVASRINPEITIDLLVDFDAVQEVVLALPTRGRSDDPR